MKKIHSIRKLTLFPGPHPGENENYYREERGRFGLVCEKGADKDA